MTSIEYLFNELWETSKDKLNWHSILYKAKEMHKQEIIETYRFALSDEYVIGSEKYYQQTFKKD
jgi:hypothetical protein